MPSALLIPGARRIQVSTVNAPSSLMSAPANPPGSPDKFQHPWELLRPSPTRGRCHAACRPAAGCPHSLEHLRSQFVRSRVSSLRIDSGEQQIRHRLAEPARRSIRLLARRLWSGTLHPPASTSPQRLLPCRRWIPQLQAQRGAVLPGRRRLCECNLRARLRIRARPDTPEGAPSSSDSSRSALRIPPHRTIADQLLHAVPFKTECSELISTHQILAYHLRRPASSMPVPTIRQADSRRGGHPTAG